MKMQMQVLIVVAAAALATTVTAQTVAPSVGRAASAAVTPGDQNMGQNPNSRTGGLMGKDTPVGAGAAGAGRAAKAAVTPGDQDMGRDPNNRTGGLMGSDRTAVDGTTTSTPTGSNGARTARRDRG